MSDAERIPDHILTTTFCPIEDLMPKSTADQNPKHAAGRAKQPYRHIPPMAIAAEGRVYAIGAEKYGFFNWGEAGVVASIYYEAILRHLFEWYTTGAPDRESGQSHLAHIRACCGILMDCEARGIMQDDRPLLLTTPVLGGTK